MRDAFVILAQLAISFLVIGAVLPLALIEWPAVRSGYLGPAAALVATAVCFAVIRGLWPARKS